MRLVSGTGDWDGDGKRDLLAVTASGVGLIYRGNGSGGWSGTIRLPGNWTNLTSVVGVGDATGDTKVDVFVTTSAGTARIGRRGSTAAEILWSDPVPWATKVYPG
jgi:hypothetical protein